MIKNISKKVMLGALVMMFAFTAMIPASFAADTKPVTERVKSNRQKSEIHEAFENDDYDTFVELTQNAPFADQVDRDFFAKLQQAHQLRQDGNKEEARAILEELGIKHKHMRRGQRQLQSLTEEQQQALKTANELAREGNIEEAEELLEEAEVNISFFRRLFKRTTEGLNA